tara:strand:- start:1980 stop:2936 length:957 start_codon:yes stop_codon:yes gene_type:complete
MKKIFITGVAGFIGFSLANNFLKKKYKVIGIDNFDDYYSVKLKKERLKILKKNKNFFFNNIDISNFKKLNNVIKKNKIEILIHLAAQAGVRYSLINPNKYIDTNILGFMNLIKSVENKNVKKFIYASSSSVYGDSTKFPLCENDELNPKNIYGLSKKINEEIAEYYSKIYNIKFVGLRFFTIYGEWGRPDMFLLKMFKASKQKKYFHLNNFGKHLRDFTYIGDVINIIDKLIKRKIDKHEIFNICSNNPINIYKIVKNFQKFNFLKLKLVKLHKADVIKTHGDNRKIKKFIKIKKFSTFDKNFNNILQWYKKNNIDKL